MNNKEILNFCVQKGFLVDKDVLGLFEEGDIESAKVIIEKVKNHTGQRVITKSVFEKNREIVHEVVLNLPEEKQKRLERLKINLGLSIEISKEVCETLINDEVKKEIVFEKAEQEKKIEKALSGIYTNGHEPKTDELGGKKEFFDVKIVDMPIHESKKLVVKDFVTYFRNRLSEMSVYLQEHSELDNLVSINKISGDRQNFSLIGLVSDKRVTKNKNIMLEVEDLTGKIKILINQNNKDVYEKAEDITLDAVLGFKGTGNREIFFASEIIFPDVRLPARKQSTIDESVLFLGDLHVGSKLFMEDNFLKFIDYVNGNVAGTEEEVKKIKYIVIAGDLVSGVGIYQGQDKELAIPDIEEQYVRVAELIGKIRKDVKIIISPGNHDALRMMEPQPLFDEKFAWALYDLRNVLIVGNPCQISIGINKDFSGFNVLMYHGYSFHYYANYISKLILEEAVHYPEKVISYLLKFRHLAPTHSSTLYFPAERDPHIIRNIPDIFFSGHTHKSAVAYYNNILIVSSSTWESMTAFQEKMGNKPDFCKVPMLNLKTRAIKILDFE